MADDEILIECVRKQPVLYDLSNKKYMDTAFKNAIWNQIGEGINIDGAACKSRWNNIRDTYRKSLKRNATQSGQGAKKIKLYKYSEHLSFLKKVSFEERETVSNIEREEVQYDNTQDRREENDDSLLDDGDVAGSDLPQNTLDQSKEHPKLCPPNPTPRRKVIKTDHQATAASTLMEYIISKNEREQPQNQVDTFLASIATTLKTFSPYHLHLAKAEIFNTVHKYEYETIMGHRHNNTAINSQLLSPSSSTMSTQHSSVEITQNSALQQEQDNTVQHYFQQFQPDSDFTKLQ